MVKYEKAYELSRNIIEKCNIILSERFSDKNRHLRFQPHGDILFCVCDDACFKISIISSSEMNIEMKHPYKNTNKINVKKLTEMFNGNDSK